MKTATANFALSLMRRMPPEAAHDLTIRLLATGLGPKPNRNTDARLATSLGTLTFDNPLGIAAGFDKNARVPGPLFDLGFGFVEVGAVTPRAQPGNDRPRVFRLEADHGVINRYGFNNDGLEAIRARLEHFYTSPQKRGPIGINLGANKDSADRIDDYVAGIQELAGCVDFYTVNISSPNTPGLRDLQGGDALAILLDRCLEARDRHAPERPLFLKVAPDLSDDEIAAISMLCIEKSVDALIVSNTTLSRPQTLESEYAREAGGLSGRPLFDLSTRCLGTFYSHLGSTIPLIGVGGVFSAADAYEKIRHGARLVQLYTGLVYKGPGLVREIIDQLPTFLDNDGFCSIDKAIGTAIG